MTTSSPQPADRSAIPGMELRTLAPPRRRHPLGLPAGSVRALLTLMVLGILWTLMLLPPERGGSRIPLYLYYLMFLAVGHFYAAHGNTIATEAEDASPLHLPRGTLRALILLGFVAVMGWRIYTDRDLQELLPSFREGEPFSYALLPFILIGAFLLGVLLSRMARAVSGAQGTAYWFQDIQAWLALLGMLGLGAEIIIQAVINPTLPADKQLYLPQWQAFLSAIVGFYFGARS